jgi:ABC-2 type transport system ATP-binding protein
MHSNLRDRTPGPVLGFNGSIVASLQGVSKSYGKVEALRNVDLNIRAGEVVALLGPNGAGKTTTIGLLLGSLQPTRGQVHVFGIEPRRAASRMRVGVMLQVSGVPDTLRVREHIDLFRSYYPRPLDLDTVLEAAGLVGLEHRLYGKLSGGQKQRLHFALALSGNPDLLFLDEPTVGLDVGSRRALWSQIRSVTGQGRTVVLSTHYLEEADALADRIVLIDRGQIIADGTPAAIKQKTGGRKITVVTRLDSASIEDMPGVSNVRRLTHGLEIYASRAEAVVRRLLELDPNLSGLEVTGIGLEEAFLTLTEGVQA